MNCQARVPGSSGEGIAARCESTVDVETWWDLTGLLRAACSKPGHFDDVRSQARYAEASDRAAHAYYIEVAWLEDRKHDPWGEM